jgi:hypothetical protein
MTDEYRAEQLFPTAVPQWSQRDDGKWVREWEIRLAVAAGKSRLDELNHLSEDGIDVVAIASPDGCTIRLRTVTELNPLSDEVFYGSAYRMLRKIDENIGRIELIQGQPREVWQPFRQSTSR